MEMLQIIILGIIQGLTEFLPVSSSGHLILTPILLNFNDQGLALDAILHLGTLMAIVIFFKKDLLKIFLGLFDKERDSHRLAWSIIVASLPAATVIFGTCSTKFGSQLPRRLPEAIKRKILIMQLRSSEL